MQNRTPVPRDERAALPDFEPVPRLKFRHDGWTPERQRAFIAALADTGSVSRAAQQVNMAQANCYTLRRAPGAEGFRAAWDAALDCGLARLKDIAFERAIEGQLTPVFVAGKLKGFSRKRNDALLMFCLRHYGQDANGRRTTINYFSTRASAAATSGEGVAAAGAEASTTTVRTTITGGDDANGAAREATAAGLIEQFAGVTLDAQASAAIAAALEACAARHRDADAAIGEGGERAIDAQENDPAEPFVMTGEHALPWRGGMEPATRCEEWVPFIEGEAPWNLAGAALPDWAQPAAALTPPDPTPAPAARSARKHRRRPPPAG
jgi:head-tail adaptor